MKKKKEIIPLPFIVYFSTVVLLLFSGLADSTYLAFSHYRNYTDIAYKSFCAVSKAINCDTVSQSIYSVFLGLPLGGWGIIGYSFLILFLPLLWNTRSEKKRIWTILFTFSIIFSIISIALALVSTIYIHSYCIMCVLIFGINFLLLYFTWLIRKRYNVQFFISELRQDINFLLQKKKRIALQFFPFLCCVCLVIIFFPKYWEYKSPASYADIPVGLTNDGYPWIGAENPELIITEFSDYLCFQCKKMNFYLRQLVSENPDKIRLIHRQYPMDHKYNFAVKTPFHTGSGELALIAIYASTKGKFWEMNDFLFNLRIKQDSVKVKDIADKFGLDFQELGAALRDKRFLDELRIDLWDGWKLGITGTPAYIINGKVYQGQIPPEIIRRATEPLN